MNRKGRKFVQTKLFKIKQLVKSAVSALSMSTVNVQLSERGEGLRYLAVEVSHYTV